jgi:putative ubiquitin-RnfH superfamily antitoxin RatB of RatAB toxin-antitoxin module
MPPNDLRMPVQVCYALPAEQTLIDLHVPVGTTVGEALHASGILERHRDIDLETQKVGIYGKVSELGQPLQAHDRIEIYRPLTVDPKVARARRVAKSRKGGSIEGRKWATREPR